METHEYEKLFELEEKYWWFVGQRFLVQSILNKYYPEKNIALLDVGCGTGKTLELLKTYGTAQGIDIAQQSIDFCKKLGFDIKKSDVMDIQYDNNSFDVVTALGIFYHKAVTDDVRGFKEIHRILKNGGRFIIFDCAMKCLFGKHDIAFHGARRYSKAELKQKLQSAGFVVEKISYVNTLLFPVVYVKRKLDMLTNAPVKSDLETSINPVINNFLTKIYLSEIKLLKHVNYPFGVNIVAVGRKNFI